MPELSMFTLIPHMTSPELCMLPWSHISYVPTYFKYFQLVMIKLNTEKEMRVVMNVGEYYELGFYVGCSPTCLGVLGQAAPA